MLTFGLTVFPLPCPQIGMPFGKNKKLSMPKAKKKKVPAREEVVEAPNETGITGEAERAPSPTPAEPAAAPSPGES